MSDDKQKAMQLIIISGRSGSGKSTALHQLEDEGYYCIDNLPVSLLSALVVETGRPEFRHFRGTAVCIDARNAWKDLASFGEIVGTLPKSVHTEVLYLDAQDSALIKRFSETRRPHALSVAGDLTGAIARERERLGFLRARARHVIDTTTLSVHDLRRALVDHLGRQRPPGMVTRVVSFGFKYGLPVDADLVFDVRYLPNPHFVPELRPKTGLDPAVARYVLGADDTQDLLARLEPMLRDLLPRYEREGKAYLTVAIGCTGGRHRSVAIAEELGRRLGADRLVAVAHRDAQRGP